MKNFGRAIAFLALLFCSVSARANDAEFSGVLGSPTLSKGEHPAIRMESEKVILTLKNERQFETDARFVFVNDSSRAVTVRMGFPETNEGGGWEEREDWTESGFLRFATTVNGVKTNAKRTVIKKPDGNYDVWWLKTVSFGPRERKNVRVMTLSALGGTVEWALNRAMSYDFTGKNWKGLVARSDLEVRIPLAGLWAVSASSWGENASKPTHWKPTVETKNGVAILRRSWTNWQAQSSVTIGVKRVMPFWMVERPAQNLMLDDATFDNIVTVRVGGGAGTLEKVDSNSPQGFVKDGVAFVQFRHLANRAAAINEKIASKTSYDAATGRSSIARGGRRISFVAGSDMMVSMQTGKLASEVKLPAAPVLISDFDGSKSLYVPLVESAQALGLTATFDKDARKFRISE